MLTFALTALSAIFIVVGVTFWGGVVVCLILIAKER
jgi:hypothetical protein